MGLSELLGISDTHYRQTVTDSKSAPIHPIKHTFFSIWVNQILYFIHALQVKTMYPKQTKFPSLVTEEL